MPRKQIAPPSLRVEPVAIGSATVLVTFDEDSPIWTTVPNGPRGKFDGPRIVRLRPPPDAEDSKIEEIRRACIEAGALAVKVLPKRKADVVPSVERAAAPARSSVREVVTKLVEVASVSDRQKLGAVVDAALSRAGI